MRPRFLSLASTLLPLLWLVSASAPAGESRPTAAQLEFFEKSVRPVLSAQCFRCHGPDRHKGGLRLDSREAALAGGDTGPVVVPGSPDKSPLINAVRGDGDSPHMPPRGQLPPEQIAALVRWVQQGAPWPDAGEPKRPAPPPGRGMVVTARDREFWSFRPIADPPLPSVRDTSWPRSPLDYFILARLEQNGLHPAAPADRRTLIRRLSFDLVGLPPTPEEVEAFLRDDRPGAYERVVDRLLASPHYGERWARHWLDVARYGEDQAHTFRARLYPDGYRYRDWVVRALNDDMPYDRFIQEQIAADLLDAPDRRANLPALGFFALGPVYYGDPKKLDQLDDRIDTLTRGFLGLTVACARCHDHKFDPIPTRDYYSLAGIFASTDYVEVPLGPAPPKAPAGRKKKGPKGPVIHALREGMPVTLRVHLRGDPATLGEPAPHHFLSVLDPAGVPFTRGSGRLELARAIASKDNPLTARVLVNRVWQHHFGKGLVRTASNFGALGERPTHPELLDYLARRFLDSGWSLKALHREILLSATYRQASAWKADCACCRGEKGPQQAAVHHPQALDPENRLLWHVSRRRLEVEPWRDAMLAVAGKLDLTPGGPSRDLASPANVRRTLYASISRHELNPLLRLFDFPDPNLTSGERAVTTVPLQQLFVLNSEFLVSNARALAARLASAERDDPARIRRAFLLLYGRPVTEEELQLGLAFLAAQKTPGTGPERMTPWEQYAQVLLSANEFLHVD